METVIETIKSILGLDAEELTLLQIIVRCVIIYILGIALVRLGKKRFLGKMAAFDTILAIVIGSLLSRAITEAGAFLHTLAACLLLILLHRLFSFISAHSDTFGDYIKGGDRVLIKNGEVLKDALLKSHLSQQDLLQSLRLNARTADVSKIRIARLERNGDISVIVQDENE